jgi:hypothetical protein
MARGWESKSVESQLDDAESSRLAAKKTVLSPIQAEKQRQREVLELSRARTLQLIAQTRNERYIQLLQTELKAIEARIAELQ